MGKTRLAFLLATIGALVACVTLAYADNLQNDSATTAGITTITEGGSTTITYTLIGNSAPNSPSPGDPSGCDATTTKPVTVTITTPAAVSAPASITFTGCGPANTKQATFSSNTAGSYSITHSISGGVTGSLFNNQANFTLTVNSPPPPPNTPPSLSLPADKTAEATGPGGAAVSYTASANDTQDGPLTPTCSPASGSTFPLGVTQVNCSVTDSGGLTTSGMFNVTVRDTTAPTLNLPANKTAEATGPNGAVVSFTATASDVVDGFVPVNCSPASGSTFPLGTTTVSCTATDVHGNSSTGSFTVTVTDSTPPVITPHVSGTLGTNGWYVSNVDVTWSVTDPESSFTSAGCGPSTVSSDTGGVTFTCSATSAGGTSSDSVTVKRDATSPTATATASPAANANGWNDGNVTVHFAGNDNLSGIASCDPDVVLNTEGMGQSASGNCTDNAGNPSNAATASGINIDKTAPTISASASPSANANGWNDDNVTVHFTCSDSLSGIDTCPADEVVSSEGTHSVSGTAKDKAGNTASDSVTVRIDKTAPTITGARTPAANPNGWNNGNVTVNFTCGDSLSGVDGTCGPDSTLTSEGANQSVSGSVSDKAGNSASATVSNINIDLTDPSVSLVGGPANGGSYDFGSVPAAPTCNASDALSGIDGSCSVSGYSAAVGTHTVTASATDKAGNSKSASATYTVNPWTLRGFYQPVDMGSTVVNTVKNGSTVPLKFEVFAGATELTDTAVVQSLTSLLVPCNTFSGDPEDAIEVTATGGTALRYDTTAGQFIYNWKTPAQVGKCYIVKMTTDDGSFLTAQFKLK